METAEKSSWRSYWSLLILQGQNAFNDKIAQFLIIPLAFWLTDHTDANYGSIQHILGVIIVLPYLLLAPVAGWLSDRFPKSHIIRGAAFMQTAIFAIMLSAVWTGQFWLLVTGFLLLAIQSTIMSPAKRGLIKELVGEKKLGSASGLLEMTVVLAVCVGQIVAGFWFAKEVRDVTDGWQAMITSMLVLLGATILPIALSFFVKNTGEMGAPKWTANQAFGHISQLKTIFGHRSIKWCALGKSFFWGFAGILNLWQITIARELAENSGRELGVVLSEIMIAASGGVVLGGVIASLLSRKRIELGLVPIGIFIMMVGTILLSAFHTGETWMYIAFGMAGFGGAFFLVPVNGQLQNLAPANQRGQILAGSSVLDCTLGLGAIGFQYSLSSLGLPMWAQGLTLTVIIFVILLAALRMCGRDLVRVILRTCFQRLYKISEQGVENIPAEGGVLLTPNHVSYLDTIILSCACPRPVRFLMVRDCFETPGVGMFARFFDTIPISRERAKEAITKAADALKEGTVVCIFPEGQLTRTGALCEIKRGFEMIARKAKAPVVPVYMDGLWGTMTSFEREKMFWKRPRNYPRGVRIHFGAPLIEKTEISTQNLEASLYQLSHAAMQERTEVKQESWIRRRVKNSALPLTIKNQIQSMAWAQLQPFVFNAIQLRELGVFRDRKRIGFEAGIDGELVISLLSAITKSKVWILPKDEKPDFPEVNACDFLFTGTTLSPVKSQIRNSTIFEINGSLIPEGAIDAQFFPAKVNEELFETFSMPHPAKISPSDQLQPGWLPESYGRALPGALRGE